MILEQVDYSIKLSGFHKKLIAGVVLTGGGAQLKNIKDLCELITTTDSRIGIPNEHLEPESVSYAELSHPMYATGIGLVLYGLEQAEQKNRDAEPEEENEHVDIFANMDAAPAQAEAAQTEAEPKKEKKKRDAGHTFEGVLNKWFNSMFNESIDD